MHQSQLQSETVSGQYRISYEIMNHHMQDPVREVEVYATPEEIRQLVEEGYLVRERLFQGESLQRLRAALDEVAEAERSKLGQGEGASSSRQFGGLFLRHLLDKHPTLLEFLNFPPTLSVARAVLGPQVQIRGLSARIARAEDPSSETHWHQHQQVIPDPMPPWFAMPQALDILIYLDDITPSTGPICLLPRTHLDPKASHLPADMYDDLPNQVELHLPAGSALMMNGLVYHRAKPMHPGPAKRRVIILSYIPCWQRPAPYGAKPVDGLTAPLLKSNDPETLELLGAGGYT
jgi:ectoine hydroxylase-related dioxygenase (phytanoyl-CoA dioxygenase family)